MLTAANPVMEVQICYITIHFIGVTHAIYFAVVLISICDFMYIYIYILFITSRILRLAVLYIIFPDLANDVNTMYERSACVAWVRIVSVGPVLTRGDMVVLVAPGHRVLALQTDRQDTLRGFDPIISASWVQPLDGFQHQQHSSVNKMDVL